MKKYTYNTSFFEIIDTEPKAYWLGFIMADGCVYERRPNVNTLILRLQARDKKHLQKFLKNISANHPIHYGKSENFILCSVHLNGKELASDLANYGIVPRKTHQTYFPNQIPEGLQHHFIRGLFDGDGCLHLKLNNSYFTLSGTKKLLEKIQEILIEKCQVNKSILQERNKDRECPTYALQYAGNKQVKKILDYLYKNATIYLNRKYKLYKKLSIPRTRVQIIIQPRQRTKQEMIDMAWDNFAKAVFV